jgi:glycosyltransferase involved in cell wall biosynthesis
LQEAFLKKFNFFSKNLKFLIFEVVLVYKWEKKMRKHKVIFLVKSAKTPSSRIRVSELMPYLYEKNISAEVEIIPDSYRNRHILFKKCEQFDLVVLQKRLLAWFEFCELRKKSASLAFDFDDAVYLKNQSPSLKSDEYKSNTRHRRFKRIVKASELLIAANPVLADFATQYTQASRVHIIPSGIDLSRVTMHDPLNFNTKPIIGWVGTSVTQCYLHDLAPALIKLKNKTPFTLRIISNIDFHHDELDIENIRWNKDTEYKEIAKFDIGIMPLTSDPFSEGKASYKLLQYLASGVPSVASEVGMNKFVCDNNNNALSAKTYDDFISNLETLINNKSLRQKLSSNGKKLIKEKYSTKVVGEKLATVISDFFKNSSVSQ